MPDRPAVPPAEGGPAPGADPVYEKPEGWPDKCGNCGASWEHIGFDYADGFNCRACGACDSDE